MRIKKGGWRMVKKYRNFKKKCAYCGKFFLVSNMNERLCNDCKIKLRNNKK